jgi:hypothetical protein
VAWTAKYSEFWTCDVADGMFRHTHGGGALFRIEPAVAFAFTKGGGSFGQTRYRF